MIIEKLMQIQQRLKAPKGQRNNFGNYNYRSAEDILEAVKPLLYEQECVLILTDEPVLVGDWHYIKATAKLTDGQGEVVSTAIARESAQKKGMDESQISGTASSYARKYAMNGLFAIDDTRDADTDEYQHQNTAPVKPKPTNTTINLCKEIAEAAKNAGIESKDLTAIVKWKYGKGSLDCTVAELNDLKANYAKYFNAWLDAMSAEEEK